MVRLSFPYATRPQADVDRLWRRAKLFSGFSLRGRGSYVRKMLICSFRQIGNLCADRRTLACAQMPSFTE